MNVCRLEKLQLKGTLDEEKEPTDDNECKLIFLQG